MKLRIILLSLLIGALLATLTLALLDLGVRRIRLSTILLCLYIAGAVAALILGFWLSDKRKVEMPCLLWIFISNEFGLLLFVALWPVLAPLAIVEIILRSKSNKKLGKK